LSDKRRSVCVPCRSQREMQRMSPKHSAVHQLLISNAVTGRRCQPYRTSSTVSLLQLLRPLAFNLQLISVLQPAQTRPLHLSEDDHHDAVADFRVSTFRLNTSVSATTLHSCYSSVHRPYGCL